jgi:tRNA pseudouridine55 synthase
LIYNTTVILNIYKEKGWTSADVVAKLKGILRPRKIGHAGTLDPLAEGVLIVLTDEDTKRQSEFMGMEKEYVADVQFGATSETYDLEGELTYSGVEITEDDLGRKLNKVLKDFIGTYEQEVPHYSAVKVGGRPLYKSARKGQEVELPKKEVTVYSIDVVDVNFPVVTFVITCSKGFYVRSFANDLGKKVGTGAVLANLVRTRIGNYDLADSKPISSFSTEV